MKHNNLFRARVIGILLAMFICSYERSIAQQYTTDANTALLLHLNETSKLFNF